LLWLRERVAALSRRQRTRPKAEKGFSAKGKRSGRAVH
jgi:hypothetical protein